MQKLIDANVILRYLLNDITEQANFARLVIEGGAYTIPEIIAEVVYVLNGVYKVPRNEIASILTQFLLEIDIENKAIIYEALHLFSNNSLEFVDCILVARHKILDEEIVTFDKKLQKALEN